MDADQSPIQFIPMTCPNCGGELMISSILDQAICNYCGRSFLVVKDDQGDGPTAKNYIEIAHAALKSNNYVEAYEYYSKVLEIEPKNYKAWFGKAITTFWNLPFKNRLSGNLLWEQMGRMDEATSYYSNAVMFAPEAEKPSLQYYYYVECVCMWGVLAKAITQIFENGLVDWDFDRDDDSDIDNLMAQAKILDLECDRLLGYVLGENQKYEITRLVEPLIKITDMCGFFGFNPTIRKRNIDNPFFLEEMEKFKESTKKYDRIRVELFKNMKPFVANIDSEGNRIVRRGDK
jgi:tetratricopeptide (TPR) repeat protein